MFKTPRKPLASAVVDQTVVLVAASLLVIFWFLTYPSALFSESGSQYPTTSATAVAVEAADPNKPASELNHHLAGYALIGIAMLIFLGESSEKLRFCRRIWPLLFIATGLFLAVWSDREIWPRGDLSWTWLIHHDFEARQHKIYAFVLILIGIVEYARAGNRLPRFWRTWTFPLLALLGAGLLLFHDHTQGSGASSPEAQAYRVRWSTGSTVAANQTPADPPAMTHQPMTDTAGAMAGMQHTADMQHTAGNSEAHEGGQVSDGTGGHHHHMTASEMMVERQHLWFVVVGVGIAFLKLLSDGNFWKRSFVPFLWPSLMGVLGLLLIVYTE